MSFATGQFSLAETSAMDTALALAARGVRGANPLVGAVILNHDGGLLASGYHRGAGTAHAEVDALANARAAGISVEGATMVVTLEPCIHTGRTGPCTQAIVDAGLARVVFATADPTDTAAGGAAALRAAGVHVASGLCAEVAERLNSRWFRAMAGHRTFVTAKIAQSLDGRIAAADGSSQWITGAEARQDGQSIRSRADAILAGTGTVLADNPRLTARTPEGRDAPRQPLRVVVGRRSVPLNAAVHGTDGRFLQLRTHDPEEVAADLYARGIRHLLIEGGATVASAFLRAGLVDELVVYTAPLLLGAGMTSLTGIGVQALGQAPPWRWDTSGGGAVTTLGRDLRLRLEPDPDLLDSSQTLDSPQTKDT